MATQQITKKRWSPVDMEEIIKLFKAKTPMEEIAKKMTRTEKSIYYTILKMIKKDIQELKMNDDQIRDKYGVTHNEFMLLNTSNYQCVRSLIEKNNSLRLKVEHLKLLIEYHELLEVATSKYLDISYLRDIDPSEKIVDNIKSVKSI